MHATLVPFASSFYNVVTRFNLTEVTQLTEAELAEMLSAHFASALRRGETEAQFLERMNDLFMIGEEVYARKGFYPDFPKDEDAFWTDVAKALLDETRDQLKAKGYFTDAA